MGIVVPSFAQDSNDGLDFLDKVENIKIPIEKEPVQKTAPKSTKTTVSTTSPKTAPTPKKTTSTTKKSTASTAKKTTTPTVKKTSPISSSLSSSSSKSSTSTSQKESSQEDNTLDVETTTSLESAEWIDDSMAMNPDYLPGFVGELPTDESNSQSEQKEESDSAKIHPLPQITGNYSIWNSFVEFLSKYQKAFYIFGILILFGVYRLRSGSSSSSRKSSPTIRRMRR